MLFNFTNLLSSPYFGGSLVFFPDGNKLVYPVQNRICLSDLKNSTSFTLEAENSRNISIIAVHPSILFALTIDISGCALLVSLVKGNVLNRFKFRCVSTLVNSHNAHVNCVLRNNRNIVSDAAFSPNGQYLAIAIGRNLQIFRSPCKEDGWSFILVSEIVQHSQRILKIDWSRNSRYILSSSKDMTFRLFKAVCNTTAGKSSYLPVAFVEHRKVVLGAFFCDDMKKIYSVSKDGCIISWIWVPNNDLFNRNKRRKSLSAGKHILLSQKISMKKTKFKSNLLMKKRNSNGKNLCIRDDFVNGLWKIESKAFSGGVKGDVVSVAFDKKGCLLVLAYSTGCIGLIECQTLSALFRLTVSSGSIDYVSINSVSSLIAVGSSSLSQLIVWDWRSENYAIKQNSHNYGVKCVAFSPNNSDQNMHLGSLLEKDLNSSTINQISDRTSANRICRTIIASGGIDGKIKVYDVENGFSFVTFAIHTSTVTDIVFLPQGNAIIASSLDGTVRAYDLLRYKNFRTFTVPQQSIQFLCVAVDDVGSICASGGEGDNFSVYVWSVQTGDLLEVLTGNTSPLIGLSFQKNPSKSCVLVSASESNIMLWNLYKGLNKITNCECLLNLSEITALDFDPRGNDLLAVSSLKGYINIWNIESAQIVGTIDGIRDIRSGRKVSDRMAFNNSNKKGKEHILGLKCGVNANQFFSSISYSSNGLLILAASNTSARICMYSTETLSLLNYYQISHNQSFDGISVELNSRYMTENGMSIMRYDISDSDVDDLYEQVAIQNRIIQANSLPGVNFGEIQTSQKKNIFLVYKVEISDDSRHFCVATSHGIFVFSICSITNTNIGGIRSISSYRSLENFCPQIITKNVNVPEVLRAFNQNNHSKAFILGLAINDYRTLLYVYEKIPLREVPIIVSSIHQILLPALLNFLKILLTNDPNIGSPHLQYHLVWLHSCLSIHSDFFLKISDKGCDDVNSNFNDRRDFSSKKKQYLIDHLFEGTKKIDTRVIFLLILKEILGLQSNLTMLLYRNYHTLRFLKGRIILQKTRENNSKGINRI